MNEKPSKLFVLSAPALQFLHGLPRWIFPVFTSLLLLGGLMVGNGIVGGLLLVIVGLLLLWLVLLSWNLLNGAARFTRVILLLMVFGYAVGRFLNLV